MLQSLKNSSEPVVIEATGVANSLKLIEKMAAASIFADYTLAQGVFVLDAIESTDRTLKQYENELKGADTILISKTDLISTKQYEELQEQLTNSAITNVHKVINGQCDFSILEGPSKMLDYFVNFNGAIKPHDNQVNYTVTKLSDWKVEAQKLQNAWPTIQKTFDLHRLKGNGVAPDGSLWHIEATPSQCRISLGTKTTPQLVWIGGKARELSLDKLKELCV